MCIVLTTHSMSSPNYILADGRHEADFLADRIGIIVQGHLSYVGTATDLKRSFGKGFKLSLGCLDTNNTREKIHE